MAGKIRLFLTAVQKTGGLASLAVKGWRVLRDEGMRGVKLRMQILRRDHAPELNDLGRPLPLSIPQALVNAQRWCTGDNPAVSILIVNWNAVPLTLECVRQIWANTEGVSYEIIVVDNGSEPHTVSPLRNLGGGARLFELGINRFFGEANNIAAERAAGKYLCFLNNDAFVQPGWLRALVDELAKTPEAGAVGPMLLFPDGAVQEAGGAVDENGYPTRFGRHLDPALPELNVPKFVDYVSAATMLVEKELFIAAGGFDLAYEPAYYEDSDLCFRFLTLGRKTRYCPAARVIHIEGSSANSDEAAQKRRRELGDLNRGKFLERWGAYLKTRSAQDLPQFQKPAAMLAAKARPVGSAAIVTPFALTPGGGERYILTLAAALASDRRVSIVTLQPYSRMRLQRLGRELGLDLSQCELTTYDRFAGGPRPDCMFTLGNHVVPPVPAHAANSWYLCQFPFPIDPAELERCRSFLDGYGGIIVYSDYARTNIARALNAAGLRPPPVEIVHPPVPAFAGDAGRKKMIILTVGRFFLGKRKDLMISAFRALIEKFGGELELHLAGSSIPHPLHMAHLADLQNMAGDLPVKFHVNPTSAVLAMLYRDAAIYWHANGLQVDLERGPEKAEHFGISIVEAMSAQCVPLVFNAGGPREIIAHGVDGVLYDTADSLVELTLGLLGDNGVARRVAMGRAAGKTAERYAVERFTATMRQLVDAAGAPPASGR